MAAPTHTAMQIQQMQQQMSQMQQQLSQQQMSQQQQMTQQQMTQQQMSQQQMNPQMNPHMNPQMNPQMTPQQMGQPIMPQQQQQTHPQSQQPTQQPQLVPAQAGVQQQQQQPPQQQQHSGDPDPIYKFKALLPRLKESLSNLFRAAGEVFKHHASQDSGKTGENPQQKFEKSLEEFYALCDQMEINLKFALEMHCQSLDSMKYTPHHVTSSMKDSQQPDTMPYPQYLLTVRTQINWAKEMHDVLSEFAKNLATDQIVAQ